MAPKNHCSRASSLAPAVLHPPAQSRVQSGVVVDNAVIPYQIMLPTHLTAQQRLWAAVLDNAVMSLEQRDIFSYGKKYNVRHQKRKLRDESLTWLKADLTTPGSFIFICETLHINPDFLRARLLKQFAAVPWNAKGAPLRTRVNLS